MYSVIENEARAAATELIEAAKLKKGDIVVIGCSTSEVCGSKIGTASVPEAADALYRGLKSAFEPYGIYIAAQCCEHLNRAIVVERAAVPFAEPVNVVPQPKAGGSFATAAYREAKDPVVLEGIRADAGIDIGLTLIGMHLKSVAVPLRLAQKTIGEAPVVAARVRPKFIGGERAHYNSDLM
ncbi:MAG: TIGR01440 family protein [Ruminococcaceae bacterium]|nr:TIGR01440 family protein [Oscillospiraceae bacterium]